MRARLKPVKERRKVRRVRCLTCRRLARLGSQYCPTCVRDSDRLRINACRAPSLTLETDSTWAHYEYIERELFGPPGNIGTASQLLEAAALK